MYVCASLLCVLSCTRPVTHYEKQIESLICDRTDKQLVLPSASVILSGFDFVHDQSKEATFRLRLITDRQLMPVVTYRLPSENDGENDNTFDDPQYREKSILQFYQDVKKAVSEISETDSVCLHSECFRTIADELTVLSKSDATKKSLWIFSDGFENSNLFSLYTSDGQRTLLKHPQEIAAIFSKTGLLPENLKNISVCFVYTPASREIDRLFAATVQVYKAMLEQRGASVTIQATTSNHLS